MRTTPRCAPLMSIVIASLLAIACGDGDTPQSPTGGTDGSHQVAGGGGSGGDAQDTGGAGGSLEGAGRGGSGGDAQDAGGASGALPSAGAGGGSAHNTGGALSSAGGGGNGGNAQQASGAGGASAAGAAGTAGSAGDSEFAGGAAGAAGQAAEPSGPWSMGYYASWEASQYPIEEIEWSGLTQIAMAFYIPGETGALSLLAGSASVAAELVGSAHEHGVKAIASIGGADSRTPFRDAMAISTRSNFIANLIALMDDEGYDGLDIDWEPMLSSDRSLVVELAERIRETRPEALLTTPIGCVNTNSPGDLSGYAAIAAVYDQLNLMSYGQAGAWPGWNSWHSSALYRESSATPLSIDSSVDLYVDAGVPVGKLGLGIGFFGICYSQPVTEPDQELDGATVLASDSVMSYSNIMADYYDADARHWDSLARVPYLSFSEPQGPEACTYISYDDPESIEEKGAYMKSKGLGGVIQWELSEGYLAFAEPGARNPLLQAIRDHVLN